MFVESASYCNKYNEIAVFEVTMLDLQTLLTRFTGKQTSDQLFDEYATQNDLTLSPNDKADENLLSFCERALGGVVGSSSGKALIDSIVGGRKMDITDLVNFFDDTAEAMRFNMSALLTSLEKIDQVISVLDKELKLVAWNKRYMDLFKYPDELMMIGASIEPLI